VVQYNVVQLDSTSLSMAGVRRARAAEINLPGEDKRPAVILAPSPLAQYL
jgi:hypothetical protein